MSLGGGQLGILLTLPSSLQSLSDFLKWLLILFGFSYFEFYRIDC